MKHLLRILSIALLAVACNDEIEHGTPIIGFDAQAEHTRAVADINSLQANGFSVWGGYDGTTVFDGRKVTYSSGAWTYDNPEVWVMDKIYNFYALYPASIGEKNDAGSFIISDFDIKTNTSKPKNDAKRIDLLRACVLGMDSNNPRSVDLTFTHMFSEIEVCGMIDQAASTVGAEVAVSSVSIYGIPSVASYTDLTNTWEINTRSDKVNTFYTNTPSEKLSTTSLDILGNSLWVAPILDNNCVIQIIYSFNGVSQTKEIRPLAYTDGGWQAGKRYRYTFTVTDEGSILFDTPKIVPWNNASGNSFVIN